MNPELKEALDNLTTKLEGKSQEEIKAAIDSFKADHKEALEVDYKAIETALDGLKEVPGNLEKMQEHLDKLDIKLQKRSQNTANGGDGLKSLIQDNFEAISGVKKGSAVNIETKAVGDMTLGNNLTGDQPRDYSMQVAGVPGQMLNVADLVGNVTISGGTYTFPRETGSEGSISTQTEGNAKSQIDYDFTMVDVNTDFIAGFAVYSKKMANNLPFLESYLPNALRRDYWIAENTAFDAVLAAGVTASTQVITGKNKIEMILNEIATLEGSNFYANGVVMTPADYWDILKTEKSTGAGYGLPGVVTQDNGVMRIAGIPIYRANWVDANKYYVGDWSGVKKVTTEGLSVEFSSEDSDNFRKNNVTARVEAQVALAIERTDAVIYGDFTAV